MVQVDLHKCTKRLFGFANMPNSYNDASHALDDWRDLATSPVQTC